MLKVQACWGLQALQTGGGGILSVHPNITFVIKLIEFSQTYKLNTIKYPWEPTILGAFFH